MVIKAETNSLLVCSPLLRVWVLGTDHAWMDCGYITLLLSLVFSEECMDSKGIYSSWNQHIHSLRARWPVLKAHLKFLTVPSTVLEFMTCWPFLSSWLEAIFILMLIAYDPIMGPVWSLSLSSPICPKPMAHFSECTMGVYHEWYQAPILWRQEKEKEKK